jgi:hypothetical protein
MFCLVATERRDARPRGRAAGPRRNPQLDTSFEVDLSARFVGLGTTRTGSVTPGELGSDADLTRLSETGKFYQVAPQTGREAALRCALDP